MSTRAKIRWLVALHLAGGLGLATVIDVWDFSEGTSIVLGTYFTLVLAQTCLLTTWLVFGGHSLLMRVIGFVAGVGYRLVRLARGSPEVREADDSAPPGS